MKTISIIIYDQNIVKQFLDIIHPMVRKKFNLEVILYTSYTDSTSFSENDVQLRDIQSIREMEKRYTYLNSINISGMVTTDQLSFPKPDIINSFINNLYKQLVKLELNTQTLDYNFIENYIDAKKQYTDMVKNIVDKIGNININVDTYGKKSQIDLNKIQNKNINFINTGMYENSLCTFYIELYRMLSSTIHHNNKIPAISFVEPHIAISTRLERLIQFGYNHVAIYDPIGSDKMYVKDLARFIDSTDIGFKSISRKYGVCCGIFVPVISASTVWFMGLWDVNILLQLQIVGSIGILSFLFGIYRCFTSISTVRMFTMYLLMTITILSTLWIIRLYNILFCDELYFKNCKNIGLKDLGIDIDFK
jgi:hypothetical protein